jgi:thiol:disulfide interchange protein DsbC
MDASKAGEAMIKKLLLLALLGFALAARADEAAIRKAVEAVLDDDAKVQGISKADFLGLYEVRLTTPEGTRIIYANEDGSYLFSGHVFDGRTRTDLTEGRLRKLNAIRFGDLPLAQAFTIVRGKGTRRCPYCRRLDQELTQVDDVTVHVFMIPIIAADSAAISKAIWCSPDRAKAWLDLMLRGVQPVVKTSCETPIEKNLALARKYAINGTPTLIFADGQRVSGWMPAARLSKMLSEAKP